MDFDIVPNDVIEDAAGDLDTTHYTACYKLTDADGTHHSSEETWKLDASPSSQDIGDLGP